MISIKGNNKDLSTPGNIKENPDTHKNNCINVVNSSKGRAIYIPPSHKDMHFGTASSTNCTQDQALNNRDKQKGERKVSKCLQLR